MSTEIVAEWTDSSPTLHLLTVTCKQSVSPKDLQDAASRETQLHSLYTLPSISQSKLNQQKAVASVTAGVYQIRTRFYRMHQCHVSAGRKEARDPYLLEIQLLYQN